MRFKSCLTKEDMEYINLMCSELCKHAQAYKFIDVIKGSMCEFLDLQEHYRSFGGFFRYIMADANEKRYYLLDEDYDVVDSFFVNDEGIFLDAKIAEIDSDEHIKKVYDTIPETCSAVGISQDKLETLMSSQDTYNGNWYRLGKNILEFTDMFLAARIVDKYLQMGLKYSDTPDIAILDSKTANHIEMLKIKRVPLYCKNEGRLKLLDVKLDIGEDMDLNLDSSDEGFEIFMDNYMDTYRGTYEYYRDKFGDMVKEIFALARLGQI